MSFGLLLGCVWNVGIKNGNEKSIPFPFISLFGLSFFFFTMEIRMKQFIATLIRTLIPLFYMVLRFTSISIMFSFLFH